MYLYLDASALVKQYVNEPGTLQVQEFVERSSNIGMALVGRAEIVAALAKIRRIGSVELQEAEGMMNRFQEDWADLVAIQTTDAVVQLAASYAWNYDLRGFDAVHLASAMVWQLASGQQVLFVTYDRRLWEAARMIGMHALPEDLPSVLAVWRT